MPTTRISRLGMAEELGGQQRERQPRVADRRSTARSRRQPAAASATTAAAPAAIACGANAAPSAFSPCSATNTEPRRDAARVVRHARCTARRAPGASSADRASAGTSAGTPIERRRSNRHRPSWLSALAIWTRRRSSRARRVGRRDSIGVAGSRLLLDDDARALQLRRSARAARACAARRARSCRSDRERPASRRRRSAERHDRRRLGRARRRLLGASRRRRVDEQRRRRVDRLRARRSGAAPRRRSSGRSAPPRRRRTASTLVRRIDDDDDREHRLARRHEADERHVVVGVAAVAAVDQLLGRAGLAGDGVAVDLRRLAGAVGRRRLP